MNNQPTYLTLIQSLLNSPEDEQIAILQANLELIDDNFAQYLREWATQTLAAMESEEAYKFADDLYSFNLTISSFPLGSRAANIEIAIACLEVGLIIFTREAYPIDWGYNQDSLGNAYSDRIREDKAENLEKAIACYELALLVYTRADFPQDWAMTQNNLATAYSDRIREDKAENIEKAIACYDLALEVRTRAAFPQQWAMTQNNLAAAYRNRIREDKAENIEKAIACYDLALEVRTRAAFPQDWAMTQNNLATAYSDRIREDKAENIEKAIACYELALEVRTRAAFPQDWAMTQNNLATAYRNRIREDKAENIEKAIACYDLALLVYTRAAFPQDWAMTQNNLATAYSDRIREDKAENIERAIACYDLALEVYTRAASPQDWAMTQNNLGAAYSDRIREDKAENIEKAIACYDLALEVRTRAAFPQQWAMTQSNLGEAYSNRIKEDKAENLEKAIACYELALLVYTRAAFPQDWAMTQENLAYAYQEKGLISEAIKYLESSLEILKPDALPLSCLKAGRNLGNLGFTESLWETAIFGYEKAIEAVEQSREWIASENRKREIIEENLNVYEKMMQSCINHQQYHKAIQTIERSKSRYLVELFTNSEIYPKTATATEKQQLQNLRRQIASLQQFLETQTPISPLPTPVSHLPPPLTKGGPGGVPDSPSQRTTQTRPHTPELSQQQEKLVTALQQLEQFLETFKQREPEFKLTQKIQPIDIAEFQKTLDPKTAIIEWYIGNSNSPLLKGGWGGSDPSITTNNSNSNSPLLKGGWGGSAFIITRDNIELITYTTTEIAQLETWKDNYLNQYRDKKTNKTWQQTLSQKLEQLSQILRLNEIVAKIPTTSQQLILVPHRYLHLFPLHALPLEGGHAPSTAPTDVGGPRYLLDSFPDGVKYSPSLQLLELVKNRITTRKSTPKNQQQLFALQNPTEDLFNADMEVETIKTRFGDLHQILLRKQATKIAFNANGENIANANYLHFSCHGVFDFDYPLQSSLILADSLEPVLEINPPQPPLAKGGLREENTLAKGGLREENTLAKGGLREENTLAKGGLREENTLAKGGLREENTLAKGGLREENTLAKGGLREENTLAKGGLREENTLAKGGLREENTLAKGGLREENTLAKGGLREENTLAKGGLREENTLAKGGLREENTLAKGGLREENTLAKGGLREENSFAKGGLREEKPLANGGLEKDGLETKRYVTLRSGRKAIPEKCLTLGDIFGELQLPKCSLVTLSACETGLTSSTTMTDEYIGLPSGFLYAGSMNVVSSLWAVDDFATAILMIKFYQELPNADSVAIALNAAQNWMRGVNREDFLVWIGLLKLDKKSMKTVKEWLSYSSKDKPPFKDPEYWAAFCATGY